MNADPVTHADGLSWDDIPPLMDELRELAQRLLGRWPGMESLQPTLLVDTALRRQKGATRSWNEVTWESRAQFFGQVFRAMQQKLIEYRRHQRTSGYRSQRRVSVSELELFNSWRRWTDDPDLAAALAVGLERLAASEPALAELVEYRFFSGLTWEEVAKLKDCSLATVKRHWLKARVLMEQAIRQELADGS
jgi:DNA-directed RNA polymerase specialized sigma24 family protein